jgi:hypothetical protein
MNYKEAHELLKKEKIYLFERNGKLKMKFDEEVAKNNKGYLKGIILMIKENPEVKQGFLKILRSDGHGKHKDLAHWKWPVLLQSTG